MTTVELSPVLSIVNGTPVVSSFDVANHFGKQHHKVVESIRSIVRNAPESFGSANFGGTSIEVAMPNGNHTKTVPAFNLTRVGFSLLAMGFTGRKALLWKIAYVQAFEAMESELMNRSYATTESDPRELPRLTTGAERKHLATTRAKIMGALGPSTPGYQRFSRTINKALGINHIRELTIDRLASVEALFDMMWLFVQAGRPEEQPKRAAFILERLEPCGDTHKDAIEEIVESLRRGWETYTRFVSNAEADMHKVVRAIIADMETCDMTAMEKYHLRAMADEIARAINEQGHLQHIAGNAMRPIMRTMIHMGNALAIKRKRSVAAIPAGRGRSRKQAALPR